MTDVTRDELARRLDEPGLVLLDVRTSGEYDGSAGYPCDARQGHIPGARHLDLHDLLSVGDGAATLGLLGLPEGAEVIVYCHSGGRSALAAEVLAASGFEARNYVGSWHEWSADASLPVATSQPAA
ncbi:rhodanese-like domain-containing protein [Gaiella sp.]|uniref:sulfurtransferase n=1 Tax=Gaiella sp. TaxID=2663207 RepID=UPI003265E2A6